jgi:hypothetical protein
VRLIRQFLKLKIVLEGFLHIFEGYLRLLDPKGSIIKKGIKSLLFVVASEVIHGERK